MSDWLLPNPKTKKPFTDIKHPWDMRTLFARALSSSSLGGTGI